MMKKVFKIGLMVSLLLASTGVFAQNQNLPEDKPEFPRVGFKSLWSFGGSFDIAHQWSMGPLFGNGYGYGKTFGCGLDFMAQKKVDYMLDIRVRLGLPYIFAWSNGVVATDEGNREMALLGDFGFDALLSLNNLIMGYDPERNWSIYAMLGFSASLKYNAVYNKIGRLLSNKTNVTAPVHSDYNFFGNFGGMALNWGAGFSYTPSEKNTFFAEYQIEWMDIPLPWKEWHSTVGILRFGYLYNLGITDEDQAILDQRSVLTFANFRNLEKENSELKQQVQNARSNEQKLENRVSDLEKQIESISKGGRGVIPVTVDGKTTYVATGNSAAADSLQAVIDGIKADQLNFYAMPFSVLYGVDEWNVSEEEMNKVKAVARVMKDNPGVKVMVVGFADYTGSDQYNMKLSEKRANEVKRLLVKKYGIAEDRISTDYKGKSVAFGDIQYALNRRVSFYRVID